MKECSKCGAELREDMGFCPQCGTKQIAALSSLDERIAAIKDYRLAYNLNEITWEHVALMGGSKVSSLTASLTDLCEEMCDGLTSVLVDKEMNTEKSKDLYSYILREAKGLCEDASKMLLDADALIKKASLEHGSDEMTGTIDDFKRSHYLNLIGYYASKAPGGNPDYRQDPPKFYGMLFAEDGDYRTVYSVSMACASEMISKLDPRFIAEDADLTLANVRLASSFDSAVGALAKRFDGFYTIEPKRNGSGFSLAQCLIDEFNAGGISGQEDGGFYEVPCTLEEGYVDLLWDFYRKILAGLSVAECKRVSTDGWKKCLCDARAKDGNSQRTNALVDEMQALGLEIELPSESRIASSPNFADASNNTSAASSGGCYVATSIYGSYDCPEVWTLRRYRDFVLAETWYGRLFVRTYYATSPTIVKYFGEMKAFKRFFKKYLNRMVAALQEKGFSSDTYVDCNWQALDGRVK